MVVILVGKFCSIAPNFSQKTSRTCGTCFELIEWGSWSSISKSLFLLIRLREIRLTYLTTNLPSHCPNLESDQTIASRISTQKQFSLEKRVCGVNRGWPEIASTSWWMKLSWVFGSGLNCSTFCCLHPITKPLWREKSSIKSSKKGH